MFSLLEKIFSPSKPKDTSMAGDENETVVKDMDKTQVMSPCLFMRPDGRPMVFSMAASGAPRQGVSF